MTGVDRESFETGAPTRLWISFPAPDRPPSINDTRKWHWAKVRKHRRLWQDELFYEIHRVKTTGILEIWRGVPAIVTVTLPFRENRRRDPHNWTGTVVKWLIDQLVASRLWPDDTAEFVEVRDPILKVGDSNTVTIEIRRRDASEELAESEAGTEAEDEA